MRSPSRPRRSLQLTCPTMAPVSWTCPSKACHVWSLQACGPEPGSHQQQVRTGGAGRYSIMERMWPVPRCVTHAPHPASAGPALGPEQVSASKQGSCQGMYPRTLTYMQPSPCSTTTPEAGRAPSGACKAEHINTQQQPIMAAGHLEDLVMLCLMQCCQPRPACSHHGQIHRELFPAQVPTVAASMAATVAGSLPAEAENHITLAAENEMHSQTACRDHTARLLCIPASAAAGNRSPARLPPPGEAQARSWRGTHPCRHARANQSQCVGAKYKGASGCTSAVAAGSACTRPRLATWSQVCRTRDLMPGSLCSTTCEKKLRLTRGCC